MKIKILFLICFIAMYCNTNAQINSDTLNIKIAKQDSLTNKLSEPIKKKLKREVYKNAINVQLTSLAIGEFQLGYMRNINSVFAIGFNLGYKPQWTGNKSHTNINVVNSNGPYREVMLNYFSESKYADLGLRVYLDKKDYLNMFVSASIFYRHTQFEDGNISWEEAGSKIHGKIYANIYHDNVDVERESKGLKFLFGINPIINVGKGLILNLETYAGPAVRFSSTKLHYHSRYVYINEKAAAQYPNRVSLQELSFTSDEFLQEYIFSIQAGIRIGVRF